jgi:hypothetical protein
MIVLILIAIAVILIANARWQGQRETNKRRAACAACRGDHDGSVLLQPTDAPLCQSHFQRRRYIERLEAKLL